MEWHDEWCKSEITKLMERGWWKLTKKLVTECRAAGKNPTSPVYKASSNIRKQLNEVTNLPQWAKRSYINCV